MSKIIPTILTNDTALYKRYIEVYANFTRHAQIDISDGQFTPEATISAASVWWPRGWSCDIHLMVNSPASYAATIIKLHPSLCIMHAEANEDLLPTFNKLKEQGIKVGVALMKQTYPGDVKRYIEAADHVLIFAGEIGRQGGKADMLQIEKVDLIRAIKPDVEIGWDGGANMTNVRVIAHAGIDVIYVGSALSHAQDTVTMYQSLIAETNKRGVLL
jgi:ribulose-phosphate 3-epimerase